MYQLWFKKYKDTENGTNWNYTSNCLLVDDKFSNLSIDIPERKINQYNVYGQGAVVVPTRFFENRTITFEYRIKMRDEYIFNNIKDDIFLNWFFTEDEVWLVRNTERGLQKIKGVFKIKDNEKYKSYAISDKISISFITEEPFFTNVLPTYYEAFSSPSINFFNNGYFVAFLLEISHSTAFNRIDIIYKNNFFSLLELNTIDNSTIIIDFRYFRFFINNTEFLPKFAGNVFMIEKGENQTLFVKVDNNNAEYIKLTFNERFF